MLKRFASHLLLAVAAGLCVAGPASAQFDDPPSLGLHRPARQSPTDSRAREQADAATDDALSKLRDNILHETLTRDLTVADLVVATHSSDALTQLIRRAQVIGGQRWLDADTCQIQLEISGADVAGALERMAAEHPADSPIGANELRRAIADWRRRAFTAVGSSTATPTLGLNRQDIPQAWSAIPDAARDQAIAAARQDAANHVLNEVAPIGLSGRQTIGDALADPRVKKTMVDYLTARPVTRLRLRDDMQAEVTLCVTSTDFVDALKVAAADHADIHLPPTADLTTLRDRIAQDMQSTVGTAPVSGVEVAPPAPAAVRLPRRAPGWAGDRLDADATVRAQHASRLIAARDAEAVALQNLRARLDALHLDGELTLGAAAVHDDHIRTALERAMSTARIGRANYNPDGSVTVHVYLDLGIVWDELHR